MSELPFTVWVRSQMKGVGITQGILADLIKVNRKTLSDKLNGRGEVTFRDVCAICWALGTFSDPSHIYKKYVEGIDE